MFPKEQGNSGVVCFRRPVEGIWEAYSKELQERRQANAECSGEDTLAERPSPAQRSDQFEQVLAEVRAHCRAEIATASRGEVLRQQKERKSVPIQLGVG